MQLNTESFLKELESLSRETWKTEVNDRCIHLTRIGSSMIFTPLTAVYYELTQREIHRGSFWVEELTNEFGFDRWEILEISFAITACDCSKRHDKILRNRLLVALGLPPEKIERFR